MIPVFCSNFINSYSSKLKEYLLTGKAVVMPTDTVYGIVAADPNLIQKIKKRIDNQKKIIRLIHNTNQIPSSIPNDLKKICNKFWPGPLTIIYKKKGYRIPKHKIIIQALKQIEIPIYASSANITNHPTITSIEECKKVFKEFYKELEYIDVNDYISGTSSTIFDYDNKKILREGEIKSEEILNLVEWKN